jgi:transcriptional regulator NrdR family protein
MEELVALDALAAVRFASVYRDFQSAEDYAEFFRGLAETEADSSEREGR